MYYYCPRCKKVVLGIEREFYQRHTELDGSPSETLYEDVCEECGCDSLEEVKSDILDRPCSPYEEYSDETIDDLDYIAMRVKCEFEEIGFDYDEGECVGILDDYLEWKRKKELDYMKKMIES